MQVNLMSKITVNKIGKIHKVKDSNLITVDDLRRRWISRRFESVVKTSRHMLILSVDVDGTRSVYTNMEDDEAVYHLERIKQRFL
jgi:hypothetical protein